MLSRGVSTGKSSLFAGSFQRALFEVVTREVEAPEDDRDEQKDVCGDVVAHGGEAYWPELAKKDN
jgi:hypothetical protein